MNKEISYYKYSKDISTRTKYILKEFYNEYKPFHIPNKKSELVLYLNNNVGFIGANRIAQPTYTLDGIKKNGKSVFHTALFLDFREKRKSTIQKAYGDFINDLFLVNISGSELEIFVLYGKKIQQTTIYSSFINGERQLAMELERIRSKGILFLDYEEIRASETDYVSQKENFSNVS